MKRKGLGKNLGKGYKNIIPNYDSYIHSLSAKGVKTKVPIINTLKAFGVDEPVETIRKGNKRAEIYNDTNPESPREWDNVGTMVAFHKRYDLGDDVDIKSDMFNSWAELEEYLVKEKKAVIVLPLYLYDHSGLRMKVGSFQGLLPQGHAEFDSGQVGFIYATAKDIKDNLGIKKITKKALKKAEKVLKGEVDTYDQYLMGDVYGYKIVEEVPVSVTTKYPDGSKKTTKTIEDKDVDSCWGFYGREYVIEEVNSILGK
jgi:predicted DNA-binding transcriptional regulator